MNHLSLFPVSCIRIRSNGVAASGLLRRMTAYIPGSWDSASLGLTSISCETSCTQDLRPIALQTFTLSRFPEMLLSPLPFGSRLFGCLRKCFPLNFLPLWGYSLRTETAHVQHGRVFTPGPSPCNPYTLQFSRYYESFLSERAKSGNARAEAEDASPLGFKPRGLRRAEARILSGRLPWRRARTAGSGLSVDRVAPGGRR